MPEILVICAHSDDQIIGLGGTLAKYASEGCNVRTIIFSYGELSHPHIKSEVISKIREKESLSADEVIGGKSIHFIGVPEGQFLNEENAKKAQEYLETLIKKRKPKIIFTHSPDDPLKDHKAVLRIVLRAYDNIKPKSSVYSFDIWNPISIFTRNYPKRVVDITKYFGKKTKALSQFKSQKITLTTMIWAVYFRAIINGIKYKKRYAEVFYKIRLKNC